jgi:two-component system response regulator AtoC
MDYFFGNSAGMGDLEFRVEGIARSSAPVLIEGETGAGKEQLAYYLHDLRGASGRVVKLMGDSPLLATDEPDYFPLKQVDCESGNTLLLKRVNRLPAAVQERLLLALERLTTLPLLISTTSEPLDRLVDAERFVPELYYRLSAHRISLPPLRERREDIPELFHRLLVEMSRISAIPAPISDPGIAESLMKHSWPGNVRELQNVAHSWLVNPSHDAIHADMARRVQKMATSGAWGEPVALKERVRDASKRVEAEIILQTLEQHRWNRRRTAASLNISYRSLLYKMKNCDIHSGRLQVCNGAQAGH